MSSLRLYDLLPAVHRARDVEQGEPLRALVDILQEQFDALEDETRSLHENLFVETCDEWVLPYLGALVGVPTLNHMRSQEVSLRGYVGNTLRYRRRKGTAPVLEQVARDLTGWPCRVVEFFQLLSTTQYMKHVRPFNHRTPDLRRGDALELVGSPFQTAAHTAEMRRIARERGRYNIANIGLFLWRLLDFTLERGEAVPLHEDTPDGRYFIDSLGRDRQLYNRARTETEILNLAAESDAPGPLRRRPLFAELDALRELREAAPRVWFDDRPPFRVYLAWPESGTTPAREEEVPPEQLCVCDLSDDASGAWRRPDGVQERVAVDPVRGRLALPEGVLPAAVRVTWAYAAPGRYAGGPYDRSSSLEAAGVDSFHRRWGVRRDAVGVGERAPGRGQAPHTVDSLAAAVAAWNAAVAATTGELRGLIVVLDNSRYRGDLTIQLRAGATLVVAAGQWLDDTAVEMAPGQAAWPRSRLVADGRRPHVLGNVRVETLDPRVTEGERALVCDGLLLEGELRVAAGRIDRLRLAHCTLVPEQGGLHVDGEPDATNGRLVVELERCYTGPLRFAPDAVATLSVKDSVLDAAADDDAASPALVAPSTDATLLRTTVLGTSELRELSASDAIFTGVLQVERRQEGCVRYSFCPEGSSTPRRFRCQPDLALGQLEASPGFAAQPPAQQAAERARVLAQVSPMFAATRHGAPDYAMLAVACHEGIRRGAENSSEMGAFCALDIPLREANLRASLDDFLPFGLEAGIFFVT